MTAISKKSQWHSTRPRNTLIIILDNNNMETKILINELKNSPMFNLSLGSKELFHSNFLAWLGENDETKPLFVHIIKCLVGQKTEWLDKFCSSDSYTIRREYKHFDLCILKESNPVLIIENKVKSIPNYEQLRKYTINILNNNSKPTLLLLSLMTDFADESKIRELGWEVVSYEKLANSLDTFYIRNNFMQPYYLVDIITDYRAFILNMHNLCQQWLGSNNFLTEEKLMSEAKDLRIADLCAKIRASELQNKLITTLKDCGIIEDIEESDDISGVLFKIKDSRHRIRCNSGFTNGSGLIDVTIFLSDNTHPQLHIQIQGEQYRHAYEFAPSRDNMEELRILHKYKERNKKDSAYKQKVNDCGKDEIKKISKYNWLDVDFLKDESILKQNRYPQNSGDYNSYLGSNVLFIYQYYKLNDNATVDAVLKYMINEIQEIKNIYQ